MFVLLKQNGLPKLFTDSSFEKLIEQLPLQSYHVT